MKRDQLLFAAAMIGLAATLINLVPSINAAKETVDNNPDARPHIAWAIPGLIVLALVLAYGVRR